MKQEFRNIAFISYNHRDMAEAKQLHRKLDAWRLPSNLHKAHPELPTRLREIFRDTEGLGAGGDLSEQIKAKLRESKFLIVICSPNSAQSKWVNDEVAYFKELGREKQIIPFIIAGKPYVGTAGEECFTPQLRTLRDEGCDPSSANVNENGFDHACVKVISGMLGLDFDTLWQRHRRAEKRKRRIYLALAIFIVLLSIGISLMFASKNREIREQRNEILSQRDSIQWQYDDILSKQTEIEWQRTTIQSQYDTLLIQRDEIVLNNKHILQQRDEISHNYEGMQEMQSRVVVEKAKKEQDPVKFLAMLLDVLPRNYQNPDRPYTFEAGSALVEFLDTTRLERVFWHEDEVNSVAFSPDGMKIVTASRDNTARVWDAVTGKEFLCLKGHEDDVFSAIFSPEGSKILTASRDNTARVWDAKTGKELFRLKHEKWVESACFSSDGTKIVTVMIWGIIVQVWDAVTGEELLRLEEESKVNSIAFSPDGSKIVSGLWHSTARVWDATTGKELLQLKHENIVHSVFFSPDGTKIVTASYDKTARVWDVVTGKELLRLKHENDVNSATFSPDGTKIVTASDDSTARVWDATTGKELLQLRHENDVNSATFNPDGTKIVTASISAVRVWDAVTGEELISLVGHQYAVNSAAFSPDGTRIVTASDNKARIWNIKKLEKIKYVNRSFLGNKSVVKRLWDGIEEGLYFTTLEDAFYSDCDSEILRGAVILLVTNSTTGEVVFESAYFSPYGAKIEIGFSGTARVCDTTGKELLRLKHENDVNSATFSPDGTKIVTASDDSTARVWDAVTGKEFLCLKGHEDDVFSAIFSPEGSKILTASRDNTARVWDAVTGKEFLCLKGHEDDVSSAIFSPDGTKVVTVSRDNTTRVWDAETGQESLRLEHEGWVNFATITPNGTQILTVGGDGVRIWNIDIQSLIDRGHKILNGYQLPSEDRRKYYLE